jgi:hypothetical protein
MCPLRCSTPEGQRPVLHGGADPSDAVDPTVPTPPNAIRGTRLSTRADAFHGAHHAVTPLPLALRLGDAHRLSTDLPAIPEAENYSDVTRVYGEVCAGTVQGLSGLSPHCLEIRCSVLQRSDRTVARLWRPSCR